MALIVADSRTFVDTPDADGRMPHCARAIREALKHRAGRKTAVRIGDAKSIRSIEANNYLWGVVYETIVQDTAAGSITAEDLHDAMCERFLPNERKRVEFFNRLTGECLDVEFDTRRSSKLTGDRFYTFVEQVREFARTWLGIETPDPDPEYWRKRSTRQTAAA